MTGIHPPALPLLFIKAGVQRLAKNKDIGHFYQERRLWGTNKDSVNASPTQTNRKLKNTLTHKQLKVKKSSQDNETIYVVLLSKGAHTTSHTHKGGKGQYQS